MWWNPCSLGKNIGTLCSPFDGADNLSCCSGFLYALELKLTAVRGKSSTLLNPAFFKIGMPFFIASPPVHNRFQTCASVPHTVGSVSARDAPIFSIHILHFWMDSLLFPSSSFQGRELKPFFCAFFLLVWLRLFDCATTLPIVTRSLCLPHSSPTAAFCQSSQ